MTSPAVNLIKKCIRHNNTPLDNNINTPPIFPCGICNYEVKHNDKSILCSQCDKWAHIRCTEISLEQYREIQQRNKENPDLIDTEDFLCLKCVMDSRSDQSNH